jgi:DNA-3-methyladenine glycosylase II
MRNLQSVPVPYDLHQAVQTLRRADSRLARFIDRVGECRLCTYRQNPLEALTRAIVYQQLHGKAAATIHARVWDAFAENGALRAGKILAAPDSVFRAAGLSRQKTAAIRDLAARVSDGSVPAMRAIRTLRDDQIVERLTQVRGIGVWSVEMFLITILGRPDVLPIGDYGLRRGFQRVYRRREPPKPKELLDFGERWRPFRTVASWYLWRVAEQPSNKNNARQAQNSPKARKGERKSASRRGG